jgi:Amt family ammonium transporter
MVRRALRLSTAALAGGALVLLPATGALAAEEETAAAVVQRNLDNIWILVAAVLVIFMQAGFALVEAGLTRAKNVANIFIKNLMDFCVGAMLFFAVGYAIAYGGDVSGLGALVGGDGWFLAGDGVFTYGTLDKFVFFTFQVAFAATAATIVSGAMAERTKFKSYVIYSAVISAVIYPVVVRWQWGGGWLFQGPLGDTPYHDFAGSSLVHMVGGITAAMGAYFLGPRIGKYGPDGKPRTIQGHSTAFAILGCFILLVGWYGFNPGSWLAADATVGVIAVTTTLAGAAGAFTAMMVTWFKDGKPDVGMTGNGLLAGLVGITAGTYVINPVGSVIVGAIAGVIVVYGVAFVDKIGIDDPVGAVAVHGICGAFGTIAVGLFAAKDIDGVVKQGLLWGGGVDQLLVQIVGVVAIAAWTLVTSGILFFVLKKTVGLRVSEQEEREGLDIHEHTGPGYVHEDPVVYVIAE